MTTSPMPIEIREDTDGTDGLIEAVVRHLDQTDVSLRGEEWRAVMDSPYSLALRQWVGDEDGKPTGPRVRITFSVHVEDQ